MLTLVLPPEIVKKLTEALYKGGRWEVGGILMAEHVGTDRFVVKDITIQRRGAFAFFMRRVEDMLSRLRTFFERTDHNYTRFNYIGEWHSHPSFEPEPSPQDDRSMHDILNDSKVGANFVILLIVKLNASGELVGTVHTYLPGGHKHRSLLHCSDDTAGKLDVIA